MKIATITPTRGDRPEFLKNALKMIKLQTQQPDEIIVVDDAPRAEGIDINWRYHKGCHEAVKRGCTLLIFWEDDDYYAPRYVEAMATAYEKANQPRVMGIGDTIYYHLLLRKWGKFIHPERASAMNTIISSAAYQQFPWPKDSPKGYDPNHGTNFLDKQLWDWASRNKSGKTFASHTFTPLSIGMKHGIGKCGGSHHDTKEAKWLMPLNIADPDLSWLRQHVIPEIFPFYEKIARKR